MEAHLLGFRLWVRAVEKAGTAEPAAVRAVLTGLQEKNLNGEVVQIRENNHVDKQALIARITRGGELAIVSKTPVIVAQPWSEYN
jgi:urea transport system substrate-binding protein